jgi:hypothetical protein
VNYLCIKPHLVGCSDHLSQVITPLAVSKSKVLVLCVLNLFYLNGSLWFLKVCYLLCIIRGYSNGWRQWRSHCIISLVVGIADYMVSEMRVLALPLLRTICILFFGDTSTDSTGTQINTHTHKHTHTNSPAPSHKISVFKAPYSTTLSITQNITSMMDEWMRMEQG